MKKGKGVKSEIYHPTFILFFIILNGRYSSADPCGHRVAGENFKHRITVHVQLYYDGSLTIRWENENKIYDYKTIQAIY